MEFIPWDTLEIVLDGNVQYIPTASMVGEMSGFSSGTGVALGMWLVARHRNLSSDARIGNDTTLGAVPFTTLFLLGGVWRSDVKAAEDYEYDGRPLGETGWVLCTSLHTSLGGKRRRTHTSFSATMFGLVC